MDSPITEQLYRALINLLDYPEEDLEAWANGTQPVTCSFLPIHIKDALEAIRSHFNSKIQ